MKILAWLVAAALCFLGLVFIAGSQGAAYRIAIGLSLFGAGGFVVLLANFKPPAAQTTVVQKIDLSGDVHPETLKCRQCGAALPRESVEVRAGAVFLACPFCKTSVQLEEEPKW